MKLNNFLKAISNTLYPWSCKVCGASDAVEQGICRDCLPLLPWCGHACCQCGQALSNEINHEMICGQCQKKAPYFDRLHAALWYQPPVKQLITDFKYHQHWENIRCLVNLFMKNKPEVYADSLLVPMPSHAKRIRERGFNAVYEFARLINREIKFEYDLNLLKRVKHTETQTGKTKVQRRVNVKNAFHVSKLLDYEMRF